MSRPLGELKLRAASALVRVSEEMRNQCVEIARQKSPSSAFDLALQVAVLAGNSQLTAFGIAKATRWLAVIRRDHGTEKFNEVVTLTTETTPTA